jgi:pyruvate dehydrogenase E2 component (dihydrolipoamide acetyltransferase)
VVGTPSAKPSAASVKQDFEDLQINNYRAVTAKRLTLSKQTIPHYYLTVDIEIDNALKFALVYFLFFNLEKSSNASF